jgi:hypothetical protein
MGQGGGVGDFVCICVLLGHHRQGTLARLGATPAIHGLGGEDMIWSSTHSALHTAPTLRRCSPPTSTLLTLASPSPHLSQQE